MTDRRSAGPWPGGTPDDPGVPLELTRVRRSHARPAAIAVVLVVALVAGMAIVGGGTGQAPSFVPPSSRGLAAVPPAAAATRAAPATAAASPGLAPDDAAAEIEVALSALGTLRSYRFTYAGDDPRTGGFTTTGIVMNDAPQRIATKIARGTATMLSTVTIGTRRWMSLGGSALRLLATADASPLPAGPPFFYDLVTLLSNVGDVRVDTRDDAQGRHVRMSPATGLPGPVTPGATPDIDVQIAARGYVVSLDASGVIPVQSTDGLSQTADRVRLSIAGVDDPANAVPLPGADEAAMAAGGGQPLELASATHALGALRSYRMSISGGGSAYLSIDRVVVNRPRRAASQVATFGIRAGAVSTRYVRGALWTRASGGAWRRTDPADTVACRTSPVSVNADGAACTFAMLTDLSVLGERLAGGFGVAGDERVNGVLATHYRSDAGSVADLRDGVDASADLWVADDGGYLVRLAIGGSLPLQVDISLANDPRNRVVHP